MAGLVPAIHAFDVGAFQDVDARDKRGHDESEIVRLGMSRHREVVAGGESG